MPAEEWRMMRQLLDECGIQPVPVDRVRRIVARLELPEAEHDSFVQSVHGVSIDVALMRRRRQFGQARRRVHEHVAEWEQMALQPAQECTSSGQQEDARGTDLGAFGGAA